MCYFLAGVSLSKAFICLHFSPRDLRRYRKSGQVQEVAVTSYIFTGSVNDLTNRRRSFGGGNRFAIALSVFFADFLSFILCFVGVFNEVGLGLPPLTMVIKF